MMPTIAALITAALGAGLLLLYIAFQPKPVKDATRPKSMLGRKTNGLLGTRGSRKWMIFAASVVGGIVAWYATGWRCSRMTNAVWAVRRATGRRRRSRISRATSLRVSST